MKRPTIGMGLIVGFAALCAAPMPEAAAQCCNNALPHVHGALSSRNLPVGGQLLRSVDVPPSNLGAFNIVINAGPSLSGNAAALAAFNRAAAQWEAVIADPITVNINAELGALPSGTIGSISSVILSGSFDEIRNAMANDAADELADPVPFNDAIVQALPTSDTFSAVLPSGRSLSGDMLATKANLKALGFTGLDDIPDQNGQPIGPNDADITFNNTFAFDFDNSDGVVGTDFETTAAHEIGHALGFVSIVDSINAGETSVSPFPLDLFRFANDVAGQDPATPAEFTAFPRNYVPGVDTITDDILNEFRMSTGTSSSFQMVDGRQASHWKADELTGMLIGLMDPTLAPGQFYDAMYPDYRAMDLIGYDISAVPEPAALALLALPALLLGRRRR